MRQQTQAFICLGLSFISLNMNDVNAKNEPPHKETKKEIPLTPDQLYQKALELLDGKKVRQNPSAAVNLLIESSDKGHLPSLVLLSACCLEGLGTPRNQGAAVELMARAAQKGAADAQRRLALFYLEGIGVSKKDPKTAKYWFEKAADQKDPLALYFLGTFYSQGIGMDVNESKALDLFLEAAYLNEPRAQVITAGCYVKGYGTSTDLAEAFAWALVAADNGFPETKNQLYPMLSQKSVEKARDRAKTLKNKISPKK